MKPIAIVLSPALLVPLLTLASPQLSLALITGAEGSEPVENRSWPAGSEKVANLETRVAWWEGPPLGGGQHTFEFRGASTADFNKALEMFARIESQEKELVVQSGPKESFWLGVGTGDDRPATPRIDWSFVVWNPDTWLALYNDPESTFLSDHPNYRKPVDPPRMLLYLGGGTVVWDEVVVPGGITVIDRRGKEGKGPSVTGRVTAIATGEPVAGVTVTLQPGTQTVDGERPVGTTDVDGRYRLSGFPGGGYYVVASKDGFATKRSLTFVEVRGNDVRDEDFALCRAVELSGVIRGPDGRPLAGARVIATNVIGADGFGYNSRDTVETLSDESGNFAIAGLPRGECRLLVWIDGFYNPSSVKTTYALPSPHRLTIDMVGTGTVRGTLRQSGNARPDVRIHPPGGNVVGAWGGGVKCEEDGSFEFRNVPAGDYLLGPHGTGDMEEGDPGVVRITVVAGGIVDALVGE